METSEQQLHLNTGASRSGPPPAIPRQKMPLTGVLVGVLAVVGLAGWTVTRVREAKSSQQAVEVKRTEDAKRSAALVNQPQAVQFAVGKAETWQPLVEFEGTLAAT